MPLPASWTTTRLTILSQGTVKHNRGPYRQKMPASHAKPLGLTISSQTQVHNRPPSLSSRYKLWTHIGLLVILTPSFFHCLNHTRP